MKLFLQCLTAMVLLSSNSCENPPLVDKFYTITLVNELSKPVYFNENGIEAPIQYPDTVLSDSRPNAGIIRANSKYYLDSRIKWAEILTELPSDTLSIFIFDSETYSNETWKDIRDNYNILKRYDLSIGDLERSDYTVTYPPDASMGGVKMWPPE